MKDFWGKISRNSVTAKLGKATAAAGASLNRHKSPIIKGIIAVTLVGGLSIAGHEYVKANTSDIYHVYFGDEAIGTVTDPEVVEQYVIEKTREVEEAHPEAHMVMNSNLLSFQAEKKFKGQTDNDEVLQSLYSRLSSKAVGVELVVDGEVLAVVKDQETADAILASISDKFKPSEGPGEVKILSVHSAEPVDGQVELESVDFVEDVQVVPVDTEPSAIESADEVIKRIETGDVKPTIYTVREGDTILGIARKFDITDQQIYDRNTWIVDDLLHIGDKLDLTVLQPSLTVRTEEKLTEVVPVNYSTTYIADGTMRVGKSEVITPGVEGSKRVTYLVTKINGEVNKEELIDELVLLEPVTAVVKRGTLVIKGVGTGSFKWPIINARITSKFGERWGSVHQGLDIVSSDRTIRAADNGKVTFAGQKGSYGNCIIIDHGNGYQTLYGHLKTIGVSKGDVVEQGDKIGVMGETGNATGVHLHFEVIKDGVKKNPISYLP